MFNRTHAQASPSVTLEKGIARLRPARPVRAISPLRSNRFGGQPGSVLPTDSERRTAAILAAVAFATLVAVCLALYLLNRSSRWDLSPFPLSTRSELRSSSVRCDRCITPLPAPRITRHRIATLEPKIHALEDRFLSYLPHSGFHNQRIAFENALVISHILNRTLLIPPVLLGDPPLRYRPSVRLQVDVVLSSKVGLEHCVFVPKTTHIPEECIDFWTHAHIPWEWLIDLPHLTRKHGIKTLVREDLTNAFLINLGVNHSETYFLDDTDAYQYRFYDSETDDKALGTRYKMRVDLPTLAQLSNAHRLLQLGTLFGTTRIRLTDPAHIALRGDVRRAMVFSNPDLLGIADGVRDSRELGGNWGYTAVHLRLGDGVFADAEARTENVRLVWWKLIRKLGLSDEDATKIESRILGGKSMFMHPPAQFPDRAASRVPHPLPPPLDRSNGCQRQALHPLLSIPLYIATDKPNHKAISLFSDTFPCLYLLHNFTRHVAKLETLSVPMASHSEMLMAEDVVHSPIPYRRSLGSFLPPFLDAIIASKARVVVGTPGSTFSRFVEDVLWRAYHDWDIVQRG
jgi:hypothetical protein